jgi:predicted RND superfamily exporter protein
MNKGKLSADVFVTALFRYRPILGPIILLICLALSTGLFNFEQTYSTPSWFSKDSEQIKSLNAYKKRFGGKGINYIALSVHFKHHTPDFEYIHFLSKQLRQVPLIQSVHSVTNSEYLVSENNQILPALIYKNGMDAKQFIRRLKGLHYLENYLHSQDFSYLMIYAQVDDSVDTNNVSGEFIQSLEQFISTYQNHLYDHSILGTVKVTDSFREFGKKDMIKIFPMLGISLIFALLLYFKNIKIVFLVLGIVTLGVCASVGALFHLDLPFNNITAIVPGILLAIGLADCIHLFSSLGRQAPDLTPDQRLKNALIAKFIPTSLTTLTTGVSFLSLSLTPMAPIQSLGIAAFFGTIIIWLGIYSLLPWLNQFFPDAIGAYKIQKSKSTQPMIKKLHQFVAKRRAEIILVFAMILTFFFWQIQRLKVNSDLLKYFPSDASINKDYQIGKKKMQGAFRRFPLIINLPMELTIESEDFQKRLKKLIKELESRSEIKKVLSYLDYLPPGVPVQKAIDSGFQPIQNRISVDKRAIKLRILWDIETTKQGRELALSYIRMIKNKFQLKAELGGFFIIYTQINQMVVKTLFHSFMIVLVFLIGIMFVLSKNIKLAFLSLLPNIFSIITVAGLMPLLGYQLNIATSIVATIIIGIAIDDTIYFIYYFNQSKRHYQNNTDRIRFTLKQCASALSITSLILIICFGQFIFADFLPNKQFGILCSLGILSAIATDLLLLPALILYFKDNK